MTGAEQCAGSDVSPAGGSAQVCPQQPGSYRLAIIALVSDVDAGELGKVGELSGHVGVDAGRADVVDHPVLADDLAQFVGTDGIGGPGFTHGRPVEDLDEVRGTGCGGTMDCW